MQPVLFHVLGFPIPAYGAALSLAFAAGIAVAVVRAPRQGLSRERMLDMCLWILVSSLVGSRLLYVVLHIEEFQPPDGRLLDIVNPASGRIGGLSVMGGLPLALLTAWLYLRVKKLPVLAYMDLAAPSVALGAGITRVGCFLNGCCYGQVCSWPVGVQFPAGSIPASIYGDALLHPTQIYQSVAGLVLFGLLLLLQRSRPAPGVVVSALFLGLGLQRVAVEFVRHPGPGGAYQMIALLLAVLGAVGWLAARRG